MAVNYVRPGVLASIFLVMVGLGCSGREVGTTLRLGYLRGDLHALPTYVALEKRYFADAGLQVEVAGIFNAGPELMNALAGGSLDLADVGAAPVTTAVANGTARAKVIGLINLEGSAIVVRKALEASSMMELRGKTVAVPGNANVQDVLLEIALRTAKLSRQDVTVVVLRPAEMIVALQNAQVDAIVVWEPFVSQAVLSGAGRVLLTSAQIWPGHPCCVVAVEENVLDRSGDIARRIMQAYLRAHEFIRTATGEEITQIGAKYTGMTSEVVRVAIKNIQYGINPTVEGQATYINWLREMGYVKVVDATGFANGLIDTTALHAARER